MKHDEFTQSANRLPIIPAPEMLLSSSTIITELEARVRLIRSAKNELSDANAEIYDRWYAGQIQALQDVIALVGRM